MKKILTFLFLAVFGFSLLSCDNSNSNLSPNASVEPSVELSEPEPTIEPTVEPTLDVHEHTYDDKLSYDDLYHWYAATCGHDSEVKDKEEHSWNEGEVTMAPTVDEKGEMTYTCKVCEKTKKEEIEKLAYREIEVDYVNGALYVPKERPLKVAQFADAHFGVDNKDWHNDKIDRSKEYMYYIVETTNPDFIVCSGDNVIGTGIVNKASDAHDLTEFVEFMESLEVPWTFMYGNHDAESKVKEEYSQFLLDCVASGTTKYLIYKEDYIEKADTSYSTSDEGRYGNFTIPVYDIDEKDKLMGAYIFLDSGTYLYDLGHYQTITEGQVDWYANQIAKLDEQYQGEGTVPTIVFTHIQLPEHAIAYNKAYYKNEEGYEFVIRQDEIASDFTNEAVSSQSITSDSGLFNKMVELGSTKAVLVGHAHSYLFQVKSHGIILGYAPQCGFSKLFETNDDPRNSYVYNVNSDFSFTSTNVVEDEYVGKGLVGKYFDGTNGDSFCFAKLNKETGLYTMNVVFYTRWARIRLYFDNEEISTTDESYTFTGDYQPNVDTTSYNLSPGSNKANLTYCNASKVKCVITYDPKTKTIDIDVEQPEIPENVFKGVYTNSDTGNDVPVVWDMQGMVYKEADGTYPNVSQWRMVIVVDSEGRIAYMCSYIPNGYGGATSSTYIRHSMYSDYKTNPAFSYLGEEVNGKCDWTLAVPEGGFIVTSFGSSKTKLAQLITGLTPDTTTSDGLTPTHKDSTINTNSINVDNIRIVYNYISKTLSVETVE